MMGQQIRHLFKSSGQRGLMEISLEKIMHFPCDHEIPLLKGYRDALSSAMVCENCFHVYTLFESLRIKMGHDNVIESSGIQKNLATNGT